MKKIEELIADFEFDQNLNKYKDQSVASLINQARTNESLCKAIILVKNMNSAKRFVLDKAIDWSNNQQFDLHVFYLLVMLHDAKEISSAIELSSHLLSSTSLSKTKTLALSILLKDSLYGVHSSS